MCEPPDLVSGVEAAAILGVSRQRVHQLARQHPDFPEPLYRLAVGSLWDRAAVERFGESWTRKPGPRPRYDKGGLVAAPVLSTSHTVQPMPVIPGYVPIRWEQRDGVPHGYGTLPPTTALTERDRQMKADGWDEGYETVEYVANPYR